MNQDSYAFQGHMFVPGAGLRSGSSYRRSARPQAEHTAELPKKAKPRTPIKIPNGVWKNSPTVEDQIRRYPETIRFGPRQVKMFTLPAEEAGLNKLLERAHPPSHPQIKIIGEPKRDISNGTVIYFMEFCEVEYLQFVPPPAPPSSDKESADNSAAVTSKN